MLPNPVEAFAEMFGLRREQRAPLLPRLAKEQGLDFAAKLGALQRQLDEARALKAKGVSDRESGSIVSGHYVPNWGGMLAGLGQAAMGAQRQKSLEEQAQQVAAAQQAAQAELLTNMPQGQAGIPQHQMGPGEPVEMGGGEGTVEGPAPMIPAQAATPPTQQEIMAWAAKMQGVNPKIADAVTGKVMEKQLERMFPSEKLMTVGDSIFDPTTRTWLDPSPVQRQRLTDAKETKLAEIEQRAEAARLRAESATASVEQRREAAAEAARLRAEGLALRRDLAAMTDATKRELAAARGGGAAGTKKEQEAAAKNAAELDQLDRAISLVEANPGAFSGVQRAAAFVPVGSELASSLTQDLLTEEGQKARAAVFDITAKKVHERYGAALTSGEQNAAIQYLPRPGDSAARIKWKLENLRTTIARLDKLAAERRAAAAGTPSAASTTPGASDADILKKYGGK